ERREVADLDTAIAAFAGEARQHADEVPSDSGLEGVQGLSGSAAASPFDPVAFETSDLPAADEALPAFDAGALSLADDAAPGQDDEPGTDAGTETETVADDAPSSDAGTGASENDADDGAGLSLVADDAAATFAAAGKKTTDAAPSIEALEQRISGLSLADVDSYGHGPERGAVLVEGGLGGPDAVRQLLA